MCGGGGGGDDPAKYQRQQDEARRQRIEQGKLQLDQIFGELEGKKRVGKQQYLNMDRGALAGQLGDILGQVQTRTTGGDSPYGMSAVQLFMGNQRNRQPTTTRSLPAQAQARLAQLGIPIQQSSRQVQGPTSIGGWRPTSTVTEQNFNVADYLAYADQQRRNPANFMMQNDPNANPIWKQQEEAYLDYANPQLQDQYRDAQGQTAFALARQGQLSGSLSGDTYADLGRDFDIQKQAVAENARGYGNQARADIASQKQNLLNMLSSSADPGATATAARSQIDALRAQPSFSPLGPLFQNATAGLAAGVGGVQARQQQQQYNNIVYGGDPDRSSGTVRR